MWGDPSCRGTCLFVRLYNGEASKYLFRLVFRWSIQASFICDVAEESFHKNVAFWKIQYLSKDENQIYFVSKYFIQLSYLFCISS